MSLTLEQILAQANEVAEISPDMNEAVKGGGGGRLLPAGYAFGRLCEYIELGQQPQEFGGKAKDPALEVQLGFALTGQGYSNDDGTPYVVRLFPMAMSRNEKAKAYLTFKALNWKGTAKHFGQLIGQAFLVKIVHEKKSKTDATIVSRIDTKGFLPPIDPVTRQEYPIAPVRQEDLKVFFWDRPTKEAWDALYIEGTYEAKDGKPAESKNRIQETILSALDFQGSPLQQLLFPNVIPNLPTAAHAAPAAAPVAPAAPAVQAQPVVAPVAPAVAPAAPLAQPAAVAVAPSIPTVPASPVSPAVPSATPAGSQTTSHSSPAVPAMPAIPALPIAA